MIAASLSKRRLSSAAVWGLALTAGLALAAVAALAVPPLVLSLQTGLLRTVGHGLVAYDTLPSRVDAVAINGGGGADRAREIPAALLLGERAGFLVALGGPLPCCDPDLTYAGATLRRLRELGVHDDARVLALNKGLSTESELRALRELAEARGWHNLAISTAPWHTRRARALAGDIFDGSGIAVYIVTLPGADLDLDGWWKTPTGRAVVLGEWWKLLVFELSR